jgi:hypothetical protein
VIYLGSQYPCQILHLPYIIHNAGMLISDFHNREVLQIPQVMHKSRITKPIFNFLIDLDLA